MRESCNSYELKVRDTFKQIREFINCFVLLLGAMSIAYMVFWVCAVNDEYILEAGSAIFNPLAKFFFNENITVESYKMTSIYLFLAIFPTILSQYICNKIEECLILDNIKKEKIREQKEQKKKELKHRARYDGITMYSICLSIDYEGKNEVSLENKAKLNKYSYLKIKDKLKLIEPRSHISTSDVLIFSSDNFSNYDIIYDTMLKTLSNIKNNIEENYQYKVIPSITTDAYQENFKLNNVRQNHFEIQSFNFKNRALSTATFAKKYKHLKHNKYAGIPIGEYAYFKDNSTDTYELNVVHKNLIRQLSEIK